MQFRLEAWVSISLNMHINMHSSTVRNNSAVPNEINESAPKTTENQCELEWNKNIHFYLPSVSEPCLQV